MQENILNNLDIIADKIFKSVETQIFPLLDKILVISQDILKEEPLKNFFFENKINGIIIIANSLILFNIIYYAFTFIISIYNGNKVENVYKFILKIIVIAVVVNNSYYICSLILEFFHILTNCFDSFFEQVISTKINFVSLKENITDIAQIMNNDIFSVDGVIKGIISFGAVSLLINFSIRYVTIIFLIAISPIVFIFSANNFMKGFFDVWIKMFITSLSIQIIVKFIIFIPISYKSKDTLLYKIILVGAIYLLYQVNNFTNQILQKINERKV